MKQAKEPTTSYSTDEEGNTYEVTEYGPEDRNMFKSSFADPNFTQMPNDLLGTWEDGQYIIGMMAYMTEAELKVCLALCRLTYGFHKGVAPASLGWLEKATGLSRQGVLNGIEALTNRGLFTKGTHKDGRNLFTRTEGEEGSQRGRLGVVNVVDQGSQRSRPNKENLKKEEKEKVAASPPEQEAPLEYYYKDKAHVTAVGTVSKGPWSIQCESCSGDVLIEELNTPVGCLCGMHEYVLLSRKPRVKIERKHPAVEAYYSVVKSKGVRYGSQDSSLEQKIATTVTDITFWRQVVVEYIARGWSALNILTMLEYYEGHRLPGTRERGDNGQRRDGASESRTPEDAATDSYLAQLRAKGFA